MLGFIFRTCAWPAIPMFVVGSSVVGLSACSGTSGSAGNSGPSDQFSVRLGGSTYDYACAAQSQETMVGFEPNGSAVIRTLGCGWPSSDPRIEIDFVVKATTPIHEQSFDLAATNPAQLQILGGTVAATGQAIYSSWQYPNPGVSGPTMVTSPGTSGTVIVHSMDPSSKALDISLENVTLPLASVGTTDPNAPPSMDIASARVAR